MGTPERGRGRAASGPGERELVLRLGAVRLVTGVVLALVVVLAAVLPADPGPTGRTAWVAAAGPGLWALLALWSCGAVLSRRPGSTAGAAARPWARLVLLTVAGLVWPVVLALALGIPVPEAAGAGRQAVVPVAVAAGASAGRLLRGTQRGRSLPAYVIGRIVASPVSTPLATAGRASLPLYVGSQLGMLLLLTRGEPAWGYRIGEWLEPYVLGHNRAGVLLVVVGLWVMVVALLPHRAPVGAAARATRE